MRRRIVVERYWDGCWTWVIRDENGNLIALYSDPWGTPVSTLEVDRASVMEVQE